MLASNISLLFRYKRQLNSHTFTHSAKTKTAVTLVVNPATQNSCSRLESCTLSSSRHVTIETLGRLEDEVISIDNCVYTGQVGQVIGEKSLFFVYVDHIQHEFEFLTMPKFN